MDLNKVHLDSCENALSWLDKKSVDLIFTSPPYADIRDYGHPDAFCKPEEYVDWFLPKAEVFHEVLKNSGSFILNIGEKVINKCIHSYVYELVIALEKKCGFRRFETIHWDKGCSPPGQSRFRPTTEYIYWFVKEGFENEFKFHIDRGRVPYDQKTLQRQKSLYSKRHTRDSKKEECPECGRQMKYVRDKIVCPSCLYEEEVEMKRLDPHPAGALPSTLLKMGSEAKNTGYHTAVFPVRLPKYFIPIATDPGDVVYDPFMGNGSTALACMELDRYYVGSELVEKTHERCEERIRIYKDRLNSGMSSAERTSNLF